MDDGLWGISLIMGLREKIETWMHEEEIGVLPHISLYAISLIYGAAVKLRGSLYASGILKTRALPCKVVSVGNITAGGTGKTPVAMHIARILTESGRSVVILSRGYKRKTKGVTLVSDGNKIIAGAEESGDEPYLMAVRLKGVPVVVSEDRYKGGLFAFERFKPDFIILDDGFQHIRLKRDLNILLVDSSVGFGNGQLLPRGILREPVNAIKRAGLVMIKGSEPVRALEESLAGLPLVAFGYRPVSLVDISKGVETGIEYLKGRRTVALAGIANPEPFFRSLQALGAELIKTFSYPDHHDYVREDVERLRRFSKEADIFVTTEKDGVKLKGLALGMPLYALSVDVEVEDAEKLKALLEPLMKRAG